MTCILFIYPFFEKPVNNESDEASNEMSLDSVVTAQVHGPGFELTFHDSKALFNFPASFIDFDDGGNLVLKICANGIEAVISFFTGDKT